MTEVHPIRADMARLHTLLLAGADADRLQVECVRLIERRVRNVRGLRGAALKAAVSALERGRPDILPRAVAKLLPALLEALESFHHAYLEMASAGPPPSRENFTAFVNQRRPQVVAAMMTRLDQQAEASDQPLIRQSYRRLRGHLQAELDGLLTALTTRIDRAHQAPELMHSTRTHR